MRYPFDFDPAHGHSIGDLLAVGAPPEPPGYTEFWRGRYDRARSADPAISASEIDSPDGRRRAFEVEFTGFDGFRVGGWLVEPRGRPPARLGVVGHGYGGRAAPDFDERDAGAALLFPCARGLDRSARPDLPADSTRHVLHGIESVETYLHGHCAADLWSAASALLARHPAAGPTVDYGGESFGGGIGAMALPWEGRFRRATLVVPSFGNHPLRVTLRCTGSGEAVRVRHARDPAVLDVLAFFDAAVAARRTTTPVLVAAARFDPAVPPPGQFAVYNALAGEKELFVLTAGHFAWPGEADERRRLADAAARFVARR